MQQAASGSEASAQQLTLDFEARQSEARSRGLGLSSSLLLLDGLAGTGESLIPEIQRRTRMFQTIVGGAAGDSGSFEQAWVGAGSQAGPRSAAALQVFHNQPWGVGLGHGLQPSSGVMKVTRAGGMWFMRSMGSQPSAPMPDTQRLLESS